MQKTVITFTEHASKFIQADLNWGLNDPRLDQASLAKKSDGTIVKI